MRICRSRVERRGSTLTGHGSCLLFVSPRQGDSICPGPQGLMASYQYPPDWPIFAGLHWKRNPRQEHRSVPPILLVSSYVPLVTPIVSAVV
ncbi:hypothetical protein NDU88_002557 [Pleurodeles waltl]|uniref:Uncharacterized protein n=1 Tax=Pleurodeles waltl TaxID=8319 RepID=A0AAV7LCN3_PLEWA|nr:hypothetical protein NDU88_002557 [Pleurodeles waltl]